MRLPMGRSPPGRAFGIIVPLVVAAWSPALAQQRPAATNSPADPPALLTLKERLGAKWMDEQRVDNCKVPLDKRGPKPRPDACSSRPTGLSSREP
jgi:hypothetical protein